VLVEGEDPQVVRLPVREAGDVHAGVGGVRGVLPRLRVRGELHLVSVHRLAGRGPGDGEAGVPWRDGDVRQVVVLEGWAFAGGALPRGGRGAGVVTGWPGDERGAGDGGVVRLAGGEQVGARDGDAPRGLFVCSDAQLVGSRD